MTKPIKLIIVALLLVLSHAPSLLAAESGLQYTSLVSDDQRLSITVVTGVGPGKAAMIVTDQRTGKASTSAMDREAALSMLEAKSDHGTGQKPRPVHEHPRTQAIPVEHSNHSYFAILDARNGLVSVLQTGPNGRTDVVIK